jgi:hypothetical protein
MAETLNQLKNPEIGRPTVDRVQRPKEWSELTFKCIPLQEGEEDEEAEENDVIEEPPPVPDPLGLSSADLRETQDLYSSGLLHKSSIYARRNTAALLAYDTSGNIVKARNSRGSTIADGGDDDDDEDDDYDNNRNSMIYSTPSEKR